MAARPEQARAHGRLSWAPQGYEDWLRHKADNAMNQCPVHCVQHGRLVRKQSRKLRVSARGPWPASPWQSLCRRSLQSLGAGRPFPKCCSLRARSYRRFQPLSPVGPFLTL